MRPTVKADVEIKTVAGIPRLYVAGRPYCVC